MKQLKGHGTREITWRRNLGFIAASEHGLFTRLDLRPELPLT
jgi:hypothetical protein